MEFIDNVTPSGASQYYQALTKVDPSRGWSDKRFQAATDWATMYYQNAYNTAMQNYMNEYNSPLQQMLRYQEAGLNPFLAVTDAGNMGSSHAGAAPRGSAPPSSDAQIWSQVNQSIGALNNTLRTAQSIYDYIQFGRPLQETSLGIANENKMLAHFNAQIAQNKSLQSEAEADFARYWNLGSEYSGINPDTSPRARYLEQSTERISAQIDQLKSLVDVLYPSQADANKAREALTLYQKTVMEGQNDAILHLDTGNPERDAIIKQVLFWLQNRLQFKI